MKANDFLKLVGEMRKEQKLFFATRREYAAEKQSHLVASKALEKRVDAVLADGRLEADEPTVTTVASAEEERQLRLHLLEEQDAGEPELDAGDLPELDA